jgi:DNA repair exonuclease SbcCD ATPase subunit
MQHGAFQTLHVMVLNPSMQERDELKLAHEKLEQERQQFEEESKRVQQIFNDGEQVQPW